MIVDVHTHLPSQVDPVPDDEARHSEVIRPDRPVRYNHGFDDYIRAMEPVDKAIAFGLALRPGPAADDVARLGPGFGENLNDVAAALAARYPEKVIGFMSVHPDAEDVMDEMERCVHDLGLRGMKLAPNYQTFEPLGEPARRVYDYAQGNGLPIVFHQGTAPTPTAPLRYAHPLVMDEIAMEFPDLKVVMAHLAHPWHADCITVIRKHPNVYADLSGQLYRPWSMYTGMRLAWEWGGIPQAAVRVGLARHRPRRGDSQPAGLQPVRGETPSSRGARRGARGHRPAGLAAPPRPGVTHATGAASCGILNGTAVALAQWVLLRAPLDDLLVCWRGDIDGPHTSLTTRVAAVQAFHPPPDVIGGVSMYQN